MAIYGAYDAVGLAGTLGATAPDGLKENREVALLVMEGVFVFSYYRPSEKCPRLKMTFIVARGSCGALF